MFVCTMLCLCALCSWAMCFTVVGIQIANSKRQRHQHQLFGWSECVFVRVYVSVYVCVRVWVCVTACLDSILLDLPIHGLDIRGMALATHFIGVTFETPCMPLTVDSWAEIFYLWCCWCYCCYYWVSTKLACQLENHLQIIIKHGCENRSAKHANTLTHTPCVKCHWVSVHWPKRWFPSVTFIGASKWLVKLCWMQVKYAVLNTRRAKQKQN